MSNSAQKTVLDYAKERPASLPTHFLYSIRDAVADTFSVPVAYGNVQVAIRAFGGAVNRPDENNAYYTHTNDFALYVIGEFDDRKGTGVIYDLPQLITQAASLKNLQPST